MAVKSKFLAFVLLLVLTSCSSTKVVDTWVGDNVDAIKSKKILVVAKTANKQARIAFEEAFSNELRAKGLQVVESFKVFPNIDPNNKEQTPQDLEQIKSRLREEGMNAVIVSSIKDYEQSTVREESGGYYAGSGYSRYPAYYNGFYGYYGGVYSYYPGSYVPSTVTTRTSKTYVLETVAYDLDQPDNSQLVAVITSEITDPTSAQDTAADYAQEIVKRIFK